MFLGGVDVHVVVLSLSISLSHTQTLTHTLLSVGIPGLGGMDGDELGVASCS